MKKLICALVVPAGLALALSDALAQTSAAAAAVRARGSHTCALTTAGGVVCWGDNESGQLGDGTTTRRSTPTPVNGLGGNVAAIATGRVHSCALTASGGVACWGYNYYGQLGDGTTTNRTTPTLVSGLSSGVAAIAAGWYSTCALLTEGGAVCWGWNAGGHLGDGTTTNRWTPTPVSGLSSGVATIAVGAQHTCVLTISGGALCWGSNGGKLGDGTTAGRLTPTPVVGLASGVVAIAPGQYHTCAVTTGGLARCWGDNYYGQLGDGTTTTRLTPTAVIGLSSGAAAIAADHYRSCALTAEGGVLCWGNNSWGQLGDGTTTTRSTPTAVSGLASGATAVSVGEFHTCAVTMGGGAKCWGKNWYGQLGDGTTADRTTPTAAVSSLHRGVTAIAASETTTCALTTAGGHFVLGVQLPRPARRRDVVAVAAGADQRACRSCRGDCGGRRPLVRADDGGRGAVLGRQPERRTWRRDDREAIVAGDSQRTWKRRGRDCGGSQPHLRAHRRRGGAVLGREPVRRAGGRDDSRSADPDARQRAGERRHSGIGRPVPHVRGDNGRGRHVLGCQRVRRTRGRDHDGSVDADGGERAGPRRRGNRGGRRPHVRPDDGWRRAVLGIQRLRRSRGRDDDQAPDRDAGNGTDERRGGDRGRLLSQLRRDVGRRRHVLGLQRSRCARGRDADASADTDAGDRVGERRGSDRCRQSTTPVP